MGCDVGSVVRVVDAGASWSRCGSRGGGRDGTTWRRRSGDVGARDAGSPRVALGVAMRGERGRRGGGRGDGKGSRPGRQARAAGSAREGSLAARMSVAASDPASQLWVAAYWTPWRASGRFGRGLPPGREMSLRGRPLDFAVELAAAGQADDLPVKHRRPGTYCGLAAYVDEGRPRRAAGEPRGRGRGVIRQFGGRRALDGARRSQAVGYSPPGVSAPTGLPGISRPPAQRPSETPTAGLRARSWLSRTTSWARVF